MKETWWKSDRIYLITVYRCVKGLTARTRVKCNFGEKWIKCIVDLYNFCRYSKWQLDIDIDIDIDIDVATCTWHWNSYYLLIKISISAWNRFSGKFNGFALFSASKTIFRLRTSKLFFPKMLIFIKRFKIYTRIERATRILDVKITIFIKILNLN